MCRDEESQRVRERLCSRKVSTSDPWTTMPSEISAHAEYAPPKRFRGFRFRNRHDFLASLSVKRSVRVERSSSQRGSSIAEVYWLGLYSCIGDVELVGRGILSFSEA